MKSPCAFFASANSASAARRCSFCGDSICDTIWLKALGSPTKCCWPFDPCIFAEAPHACECREVEQQQDGVSLPQSYAAEQDA